MSIDTKVEQAICQYLQSHPDFFQRHPYVLLDLNLQGESQGLPNMALMQQRLLREENQALKNQLSSLIDIANENQTTFSALSQCQRALQSAGTLDTVETVLSTHFEAYPDVLSVHLIPNQEEFESFNQKRFSDASCYLGRLTQEERTQLALPDNMASAAIYRVSLTHQHSHLLGFTSKNVEHFSSQNNNLMLLEFIAALEHKCQTLT